MSQAATPMKPTSEHPEWPKPEREGGLLIGSDVSVRVLGWIENWGWHPVVLHEDNDTYPPRYFWEDPLDCFKPKELRERLRGWVPMPPEPEDENRERRYLLPNGRGDTMEIPLHRFTTLVNAIEAKQAEIRNIKIKLQELIYTGTLWARIMNRANQEQDLHRIGMVTDLMTGDGKLLFMVHILMRTGPDEGRGYLWGDASWTRRYRNVNDLEIFTLENKGGRIQVPRMEFQGSIDGPCAVFPENWIWNRRYTGPKLGEGDEIPHPEE